LLIKDSRERLTWEEYFDHPFFNDKKYEAFEASEASESSTKNISNISNKIIIKLKISKNQKKNNKKIYFLEMKRFQ
jgi:hypothetical protein